MTSRRQFLHTVAGGAVLASPLGAVVRRTDRLVAEPQARGWDLVPEILARIVPPKFALRDFDITRYGAVASNTDNTAAIKRAIDACSAAGGGRVIVPAGRFVTGPIHLKSNVNLHVARGATLTFTRDTKAYLPAVLTRFEGVELMNYSPLIYAFEQENVGVSGEGTLDGQANNTYWWPWKGGAQYGWKQGEPNQLAARARLIAAAEQGMPVAQRVFGEGDYLRPSFIQPYRCKNVLIEGVTIVNSPMWEVHPVLCQNVTVRALTITTHGPNNDGCNPESCRDVLIDRCVFDTGDDCIAIKSGRNADGRRINVPSENIVIRNCEMRDGHGGVTIGSEISGGCWNVFAYDCRMDSPQLDRALRFKNNAMRGGLIEHVYMKDVQIGQVADSVLSIDFFYEEGEKGPFKPVARNIEMLRVSSKKSPYGVYMRAFPSSTIENIRVIDCKFENVEKGNVMQNVQNVTFNGTTINGKPV